MGPGRPESFGTPLCRDRHAAGLTQAELAEAAGLSVRARLARLARLEEAG